MIPAGKPLKTDLDVAATDFSKLLVELRAREFNGYVAVTVKGTLGIEEGVMLMEKGRIIGCSYEYYKHGITIGGQKAFERLLNATAAKHGVIDIYELETEQIELTLAFNENLVFVPSTGDLRHVRIESFSPALEQEVITPKASPQNAQQTQPLPPDDGQLTRKYKLTGLTKTKSEKGVK